MSKELTYRIDGLGDVHTKMRTVWEMVNKALREGAVEVVLRRPSKNRIQEEKYHTMIGDIHRQCFRAFSAEGVKAVLVNQFAREMEDAGTPLAHPGEKVWDWQSREPVYVRPSTKKFRKAEASQFVEFLYSVGAEYGVKWSEKALEAYEEYREARAAA